MSTKEKLVLAAIITGIVVTISAVSALVGSAVAAKVAAQPSVSQGTNLGSAFAVARRFFPSDTAATTTRQYLNSTTQAKSSFIIPVEDADLIDLNVIAEASSTSAVLRWDVAFSSSYDNTTGNGDWYCADASSVAIASTTHSAACHEHQWTPGTVSTSTKNVSIEPVAAKYARIRFYATTGDFSIHAEADVRKPVAR